MKALVSLAFVTETVSGNQISISNQSHRANSNPKPLKVIVWGVSKGERRGI